MSNPIKTKLTPKLVFEENFSFHCIEDRKGHISSLFNHRLYNYTYTTYSEYTLQQYIIDHPRAWGNNAKQHSNKQT